MKDEHIEIFYDHYKDTFEKVVLEKERRQKYFFGMLIFTFLLFIIKYLPSLIDNLANDLLKNKLSTTVSIDLKWIKSLVLFSFIWIIFSYFQSTLNIERLYDYLHKTEEKLSARMGSLKIYREGHNYLDNYPLVLSLIHRIYNIVIPITIIIIICILWKVDNFIPINKWDFNNIIDTIIEGIIIISTILFFIRMNKMIFKKKDS